MARSGTSDHDLARWREHLRGQRSDVLDDDEAVSSEPTPADELAASAFSCGERLAFEDYVWAAEYVHLGVPPSDLMNPSETDALEAMPWEDWRREWWRGWGVGRARLEEG